MPTPAFNRKPIMGHTTSDLCYGQSSDILSLRFRVILPTGAKFVLGSVGSLAGGDAYMSTRRILCFMLVCTVLAALLSPLLEVFFLSAVLCEAQTPCDTGTGVGTMELKYDDGIAYDVILRGVVSCASCSDYQGVWFTLPEGSSSSVLKGVRVYVVGSGSIRIHVTDSVYAELMNPVVFAVKGAAAWYDIPLADVAVPSRFSIAVERKGGSVFKLAPEPFYDAHPTGHSWYADGRWDVRGQPPGDYMIRAVIVPTVDVGTGQDYETIQEAVDSVWDGWNIVVHEGTYSENVTVDKSVVIKSASGPAKTIVQTSPAYPDSSVFRITTGCVILSGFTIQGAVNNGRAGVYIDDAANCLISGNVIQDNNYGIYVSEGSTQNILLENECKYNTTGIWVDGSENYLSGNKLHGNTAPIGSAVLLSSIASGNQLRFNTTTVDPGTDHTVAVGPQIFNQNRAQEVSAVENWWGTETGPSNAGGQGPLVGDNIRFDPWLTKQPVRVKTSPAVAGGYVMDARAEMNVTVLKEGVGTPIVSTASFAENPFSKFPGRPFKWTDVLFKSTDGIDQVEVRVYNTADELAAAKLKEGSLRVFWWNGEKWKVCSKTSVNKKNDFVYARLNLKTKPTSNDLAGTMFAVGVPKGGFAWWLIPLIIVIVLVLLFVFRLLWVLVIKRDGGYTSID
jgi:parallel beta-helix repeat protein